MDWGDSAPTTHLEVVTIYRPTRVVAAVCCFIVTLLMIISICPTDWVDTMESPDAVRKYREGLFRICPTTSMEGVILNPATAGCLNQDKAYVKGVAALIIISWILTLAAGCLITYGMLTHLDELKIILYRIALVLLIITGVLLLIALITFPVMVSKGLAATVTAASWSLGWAYMLDWASLVIVVLTIILLTIERNPDETSVREKVIR